MNSAGILACYVIKTQPRACYVMETQPYAWPNLWLKIFEILPDIVSKHIKIF